jgi:hypothetical protein
MAWAGHLIWLISSAMLAMLRILDIPPPILARLLTAGRLQIPHRALHVGVTELLLHSSEIDASPQAPGCERGAEFVKPEVLWVELCTLGDGLEIIEKI